jgi:hypothetical protein
MVAAEAGAIECASLYVATMSGERRPRAPTARPALFAQLRMSAVEDVVMQSSVRAADGGLRRPTVRGFIVVPHAGRTPAMREVEHLKRGDRPHPGGRRGSGSFPKTISLRIGVPCAGGTGTITS